MTSPRYGGIFPLPYRADGTCSSLFVSPQYGNNTTTTFGAIDGISLTEGVRMFGSFHPGNISLRAWQLLALLVLALLPLSGLHAASAPTSTPSAAAMAVTSSQLRGR